MKHLIYFIASLVTAAFIFWLCLYTVHLVIYDPPTLFIILVIIPLLLLGVRYIKKKVFEYLADEWWDNGN